MKGIQEIGLLVQHSLSAMIWVGQMVQQITLFQWNLDSGNDDLPWKIYSPWGIDTVMCDVVVVVVGLGAKSEMRY